MCLQHLIMMLGDLKCMNEDIKVVGSLMLYVCSPRGVCDGLIVLKQFKERTCNGY